MKIRIGTRGSKLALWQAHYVREKLQLNGVGAEIVVIETKGDKILDVSIAKIGSKGVFTEEIEQQLENGEIDIAVHSAKDLQSHLPDGFEIIAFGEREQSHDVLVSHQSIVLENTDQLTLGTSSTRRIAFLKKHYPLIKTVAVRGNLQTRIRKMQEGACDALWLAYAGVHRMAYDKMVVHSFDENEFIPPVGQGSIAVECVQSLDQSKKDIVRKAINHETSEICLKSERAFLREMNGGCSIPVFAKATLNEEELTLKGGIIALDGKQQISKKYKAEKHDAESIGKQLGKYILEHGGKEILQKIRPEQQL